MKFKQENIVCSIHEKTLQEYLRYSHEILMKLHDSFEKSENQLVVDTIKIIGNNQFYYHLQYHQKIIINFLYLKQVSILSDFFISTYRVFLHKGVSPDFFKVLYRFFIDVNSSYLYTSDMVGIAKIYNFLEKNHELFIKLSKKEPIHQKDEFIEQLFMLGIALDFDQGVSLCEEYCQNLEGFNHFFSTKITPLMELVGYRWETGEISFAQEHRITSYIDSLMEFFMAKFQPKYGKKNYTIIVSNAPNEEHSLAVKLLVNTFTKLGHNVLTIENDLPIEDLLKTIHKVKADFVAFSITLCSNIYPLMQLIEGLNNDIVPKNYKIVVGGRALISIQEPLKVTCADLFFSDVEQFVNYFEG